MVIEIPRNIIGFLLTGVQVSMIGAGTENENNWILTASGNVVKKGWVPFYNQAKRIDMKQLKSTMWKEISEKCDNSVSYYVIKYF